MMMIFFLLFLFQQQPNGQRTDEILSEFFFSFLFKLNQNSLFSFSWTIMFSSKKKLFYLFVCLFLFWFNDFDSNDYLYGSLMWLFFQHSFIQFDSIRMAIHLLWSTSFFSIVIVIIIFNDNDYDDEHIESIVKVKKKNWIDSYHHHHRKLSLIQSCWTNVECITMIRIRQKKPMPFSYVDFFFSQSNQSIKIEQQYMTIAKEKKKKSLNKNGPLSFG